MVAGGMKVSVKEKMRPKDRRRCEKQGGESSLFLVGLLPWKWLTRSAFGFCYYNYRCIGYWGIKEMVKSIESKPPEDGRQHD